MLTNSKSLVIFILFAVLWLENKAHRCRLPREKTHKKFGKETTSSKTSTSTSTLAPTPTPAPTSTSTSRAPITLNPKCNNTSTEPSCQCVKNFDSVYYPVPKSGKCKDVFKRLPTTPTDYHFREDNCHKVQTTVCTVDSYCWENDVTLNPDPDLIDQTTSGLFCSCVYLNRYFDHQPVPKSGKCSDLDTLSDDNGRTMSGDWGRSCTNAQTVCANCYNNFYVNPTECDPQTCNSASEPFCKCGFDDVHSLCSARKWKLQ